MKRQISDDHSAELITAKWAPSPVKRELYMEDVSFYGSRALLDNDDQRKPEVPFSTSYRHHSSASENPGMAFIRRNRYLRYYINLIVHKP